jgi:hypothetical protein
MGWLSTFRSRRKNELGNHRRDQGERDAAARAYRDAIRLNPSWEAPWFNLGLIHKERREWPEALQCNLKALELVPDNPPAYWNLGIAATALGRWDLARMAWQRYGVTLPAGEGPIDGDFGLVPIRVDPDQHAEVVWCRRLDPARARIENVPTPECGRRWRDIVLNDGEPRGYRRLGDRDVPVFNELQRLTPSQAGTFRARIQAGSKADCDAVEQAFDAAGWAAEDWTSSFRMLCAKCSEGNPDAGHNHHHEAASAEWQAARNFGIACDSEATARGLLENWVRNAAARGIDSLEQIL